MRKLSLLILAFILVVPSAAYAKDLKIGIIDTAHISAKSKAAQSVQAQLKAMRDSFDAEITAFEKKMQEEEKNLKAQQAKVSAEEFTKLRKQAEASFIKGRESLQQRKLNVDKAVTAATSQIQDKLVEVVNQIAAKEKFNLIMTRQQVIFSDKEMNITDNVLVELDKALPVVTLK